MTVRLATSVENVRRCFPVMRQLRPRYDEDSFLAQVRFAAHRFYLRQRMDITSHHFTEKLSER